MKMRLEDWRNAAYRYLKENGPAPTNDILDKARTMKGRPFTSMGPSLASAAQLLRVDPRFKGTLQRITGASVNYEAMVWRVVDDE